MTEPCAGPPGLPNLVLIGSMKCATTALHQYLSAHPEISMSPTKELNFFNGGERPPHDDEATWWITGQWHRGVAWYASQFDARAPVRGESSPAYTSPSFPEVARRMATVIPAARLVYLVRDPVERAVSQYAHHHRDGTERRPLTAAVMDPGSQYLSRSRYWERLQPFLRHCGPGQVQVIVQERLLRAPAAAMRDVYRHAGADPTWSVGRSLHLVHVGDNRPDVPAGLREAVWERVEDDVTRLRTFLQDDLPEWARH
jgi:hypothetical protein